MQKLSRLKMITRLEEDILADMMICEIEGWDKLEYINMLRDILNGLGKKHALLPTHDGRNTGTGQAVATESRACAGERAD